MNKINPLTGKDLAGMFRSEEFKALFAEAADYVFDNGYESCFAVSRDMNTDEFNFSEFIKGNTVSAEGAARVSFDSYLVIELHFHPGIEVYGCCPSEEDLFRLDAMKHHHKVDYKPIEGIARIDENKKGEVLLLQENTFKEIPVSALRDLAGAVYGVVEKKGDIKEIADEICQAGLHNAAYLKYRLSKGGVLIPDKELRKLEIFAYEPVLLHD
jgi:hypothetical protein